VLLLFEYLPKGHLGKIRHDMRLQKQYFAEIRLLDMFKQVCEGVYYLHSHKPKWAHRDIKIENVLVRSDGHNVVLMDFGSTTEARVKIKSRQQALELQDWAAEQCTMFYRAPELFDVPSNCIIDERTDVWSLGCLLYAMAYGESPFERRYYESGGSVALAAASGKYEIPRDNPYSKNVTQMIGWLIKPNPSKRPFLSKVVAKLAILVGEEKKESFLSINVGPPDQKIGIEDEDSDGENFEIDQKAMEATALTPTNRKDLDPFK